MIADNWAKVGSFFITNPFQKNNKLFVHDENYGIIVFDNLGQYIKVLPLENISHFQTDGIFIYTYNNESLKVYTTKLLEESVIELPKHKSLKEVINIWISPKAFYYVYKDGVSTVLR